MKLTIVAIAKKNANPYLDFIERYLRLFNNYIKTDLVFLTPADKIKNVNDIKVYECQRVLEFLKNKKKVFLVMLEEKQKQMDSFHFAQILQTWVEHSKEIVLLVGGAYGFDEKMYLHKNFSFSLSTMTFPHHLALLVLSEQLYRASTILQTGKYHH